MVNVHPAKTLEKEFLEPLWIIAYNLAKAIRVQQSRISVIINEERGITAYTVIRFA